MRPLRLALQLLRREWHSGELRTLALAVVIAVTAVASIGLVTDRLAKAMTRESAELIGGHLVVRSTRPPDPDWRLQGEQLGLRVAETFEFGSVLFFGDNLLLSGIKAVSDGYPLVGSLQVAAQPGERGGTVAGPPEPGTAWVDARVLTRLGARVGDEVHFGASKLRITGVLTYEPDQGNVLFQFAPRVLINAADLEAAEVTGPGSRVRYKILYASNDPSGAAIRQLRERLEPQMSTGHRLIDPLASEGNAGNALLRALQFVKLTALLAIILAAIAIALAARRYSERHYDVSATLRCLGAVQSQVTRIYSYQLGLLSGAAVLLGCLLGWLAESALMTAIAPLLPAQLPPAGLEPLLSAVATGLLLVCGFALPPVLRLARVTPLRIFRRDLIPMPLSGWLVYSLSGSALGVITLLLFDDVSRVMLALLIMLLIISCAGALLFLGLRRLRRGTLAGGSLLTRSIRNLATHAGTSTSQILAFGLTLWVMLLIGQLRTDLLADWQLQLPEKVANHFAFNIMPADIDAFIGALAANGVDQPAYPIVRGRLLTINGEPIAELEELDTNRELNLTWTETLPYKNEITKGEWPPTAEGISVEAGYAERLGLSLGDRLGFDAGGHRFSARVTSLRTVVWESFTPNFYIIFAEERLADLPTTYLTSFRLEPGQQQLLMPLIEQFPSVTLIEIEAFLERLQMILSQVSLAVELMMMFVLMAGFAVLFAAIVTTVDERLQEGALMRAVGASRAYLRRACLAEFGLLGLGAGILAVVGAESVRWYLYQRVFELDFNLDPLLLLSAPLLAALAVSIAGYSGCYRVIKVSPAKLLGNY